MNIFKYRITYGTNEFLIPLGSKILQPMLDLEGSMCIWALQPTDTAPTLFRIKVCFTGCSQPITPYDIYLGSLTYNGLVCHVFQS